MATNVIHGTGKPRIAITTPIIHSNVISEITDDSMGDVVGATVVKLTNAISGGLTGLNTIYGLKNAILWAYNSSGVETWGKILSFSDTAGHFITIESWENGIAVASSACWIQGYRLDLPYCQKLTEIWIPDFTVHKLYNGKIYRNKKGFYYSASLDYSSYIHKDDLGLFRQLLRNDKYEILFYPRRDNISVAYKVDISPESEIILNQMQHHAGHRSFVINLIGVERLTEVPVYDPESSGGYGDDYGTDYGIGL